MSARAAATRDSIEQSLRELIQRFDAERDVTRGGFAKDLSALAQSELAEAKERLRAESVALAQHDETRSVARIDAIRGELEQRIENRLAERGAALEGRLSGVERALAERVEKSLASSVESSERTARERAEAVGQKTSAALGDQVSALIERELKSALERQSAALAAAALHHRRALEKTIGDRGNAAFTDVEQKLVTSLDRRLGEIQAVVDSQVRQRAEGFETSLADELRRVKQELSATNTEGMVRIGSQLSAITETKQQELTRQFEETLERHRTELADAAEKRRIELEGTAEKNRAELVEASETHLLERTETLQSTVLDQIGALESTIAERLEAAERKLAEESATAHDEARAGFDGDLARIREELAGDHKMAIDASSKSFSDEAERAANDLAVRAEQNRIELGSRIETRLREAREELDRSNAEAISAAEQRTLVEGGAAVNRLVAEAVVGAEAKLEGRVQEVRAELMLSVDDATTRMADRIEAEIADRLDQARTALEASSRDAVQSGRAELEASLSQHTTEQVSLRADELRQGLKDEAATMISGQTDVLRKEAEVRAREGEQRAVLSATEASRSEFAARVDAELERLAQGNELKLGDHEQRVGAVVEQGKTEIDHARAQIEEVSRGLERRAKRHELKLVKAESKKRIEVALQGVETQAASIEAHAARADERLVTSKAQLEETESRIANALGRMDSQSGDLGLRAEQALARLEAAIGEIEGSRSRVLSVEQRVGEAELQVRRVGEMSDQASSAELRIRRATEAEADAAAKIFEAEQRLTNLVDY